MKISKVLQFILDIFFPTSCTGCGRTGSYLCDRCVHTRIKFRIEQECHVCKHLVETGMVHEECRARTNLDGVFVAVFYSKFIENYLADIKYNFYFAMIEDIAQVMIVFLEKDLHFREIAGSSLLTFVPLNGWRRRWRGFNQAEELAKSIAQHWNMECIKLLTRHKKTKSQVGLSRIERLKNLKGAFGCVQIRNISKRSVIIVDDVMTTGSTLEECARALKQAGWQKVYGLVIARG